MGVTSVDRQALRVRTYGTPGATPVVVLHGGPGAPGSAGPLARGLVDPLYVVEPWQRWSGEEPLTVERHVADLAATLGHLVPDTRPVLVGESWGAMLALVFASRFPGGVAGLVLVGCGTFDEASRATLQQTLDARTSPALRARLDALENEVTDEAARFLTLYRLCDSLYTFERASDAPAAVERFDLVGHRESWADMFRLQASGALPAAFGAITCPVLMVHGAYDPHPGAMTRDTLRRYVPQLAYRELDRCGHSPWIERHARERFFALVRAWPATRPRSR